jgi:hypothetical protein
MTRYYKTYSTVSLYKSKTKISFRTRKQPVK